jgi:hypothetical protein
MPERHFYQYTCPETHGHTHQETSRFRHHLIEAKGEGRAIRRDRSEALIGSLAGEERYMAYQRHM